jgi:amino acid adenylation domain-containing protein
MTHVPIQEIVRRAAERFGSCLAIDGPGMQVTYRQLAARADRLAAALRASGAAPGTLVAVLTDRTDEVITAMLATLQAGCAFVPLDPASPVATLPAVLAEVRPAWWLAGTGQLATVAELRQAHGVAEHVLPLADAGEGGEAADRAAPAAPAAGLAPDPDGLCYVYFTSGSTGRPKGICGRLKAIDHFVSWEVEAFGVESGTRVSQLTSPAFDAFLRDAFVPLAAGGTVCVPDVRELVLDGRQLAEWIDRQGLNLVHCTPSLFRSLLAQDLDAGRFPALRHVLLAGEPLLPSDVKRWYGTFGDRIQLVNLYGPTETTMVKLFHRVRPEDGDSPTVPVGLPMPGARAIVVDDKGQACRAGKVGEIYIRTPYRSLGYLHRPELTQASFVQNPWSDRPDDVVYRTGDLGRVREDGTFECLGRRDQQVKVRGVRIELEPIEDLLRGHPQVADAVVATRDDVQGSKFLCAYVVAKGELEPGALAGFLASRLPAAMVPAVFVAMDALPRTLSGKVNRRGLPDPGQAGGRLGPPYAPPRTPAEEELCAIFAELLGIARIGIHDSFFQLGGHSLSATLLLSRIHARLGVDVSLRQVFQTPTAEGLALAVVQLQLAQEDRDAAAGLLREVQGLSAAALDEAVARESGERARAAAEEQAVP